MTTPEVLLEDLLEAIRLSAAAQANLLAARDLYQGGEISPFTQEKCEALIEAADEEARRIEEEESVALYVMRLHADRLPLGNTRPGNKVLTLAETARRV